MKKKYNIYVIILWVFISIIIYEVSHSFTHSKMKELKEQKLELFSKKIKDTTQILIDNKKDSMITLALSLSQDSTIKEALKSKDKSILKLKDFSQQLRQYSDYKNVWFQLIDKNGISFYRSWINDSGDKIVDYRSDIAKLINEPKIFSTISVDNFDISFKALIPLYDENDFLGIFEVITHFNSITNELREDNIESIFIVDKRYKELLTKAFSKNFVEDYYIANINVDKNLLNYVKQLGINKFINEKKTYTLLDKDSIISTVLAIKDINNNQMGYAVLFSNINENIDFSDIKQIHKESILYVVFLLILLSVIGYIIASRRYTIKVEEQENKISTIIDSQPSIIIITNGKNIQEANKRFFKFFYKYNSLEEFKKEHDCICDFFEQDITDPDYITFTQNWLEYIFENPLKDLKVAIKNDNKLYHFLVKAKNITTIKNQEINIVTFIDITKEIEHIASQKKYKNAILKINQLKESNIEKRISDILKIFSQTFDVTKISIWLFNENKSKLESFMCIDKEYKICNKQQYLESKDYPLFFEQIFLKNIINANNINKNIITKELLNNNLNYKQTKSILIIPIVFQSNAIGIINIQEERNKRLWTEEEIDFSLALAGEISLALEIEYRINLENQLLKTTTEQNQLLSLFDKSDSVLIKLKNDEDLSIEYISQSITKLLGYDKDEIINNNIEYSSLIYEDDKKNYLFELNDNIDKNELYFRHKPYRLISKDKNIKWVLDYKIVIRKNNKVINYIGYILDITNQKEKEQLLQEQTKMAALGEMIGNIAHQWRQPLSVISTVASGLNMQKELNSLKDEDFYSGFNLINKNAQYLSKTIDEFRDFVKGNSQKEFFYIRNLIESFLNIMKTTIEKNSITININIDENLQIFGLKNELNQCLINLFNNSNDKFNELNIEKRYIFINSYSDNEFIYIIFKDNCGGINSDIINKIYEPYFTTKHKSQGTGLGLNIVYRLITQAMNGFIYVENDNYEIDNINYTGAKFIIKIPIE